MFSDVLLNFLKEPVSSSFGKLWNEFCSEKMEGKSPVDDPSTAKVIESVQTMAAEVGARFAFFLSHFLDLIHFRLV